MHAFHNELVSLHVLDDLSPLLGFPLQAEEFLRIWHLQPLHFRIVIVGRVVDAADTATSHRTGFRPVVIESRAVCPRLKRNVVAKVIAGGIFNAFHQAVVECTPQVIAIDH